MEDQSIEAVLGKNVGDIRKQLGLTLSDVSRALRQLGISWSTGRLGDIEAGRGTASIQVVAALALVFSDAAGAEEIIAPKDLLRASTAVQLGRDHALLPQSFNTLMVQGLPGMEVGQFLGGDELVVRALKDMSDQVSKVGPGVSVGEVRRALERFSDVDYRNAHRLKAGRMQYIGACLRLWGQLLSDESDSRAPTEASPQKKGRITRDLLDQLRGQLRVDAGEADPSEIETVTKSRSKTAMACHNKPQTFNRYKVPDPSRG